MSSATESVSPVQGTDSGTLYLVDAHSLIFQVFFGIRGMTSPSGLPTNALFGFVRDLLFLRAMQPTYLLCAFDLSEPTFRSDLYPDYKAHRDPMPDDLTLQIPLIHRALGPLGVPAISMAGYEADDVMATIAQVASARGLEVFVCTADKDCRQLINDRVRLFNLRTRQEFGRAELIADWGIEPGQVVDLQALVGDSVDNVPGVPGIGIKTASRLLQEFGTLENILASVDRIAGAKRQENLRAAGPIVELSRQLVRLATDVPIQFAWDDWRLKPIDTEPLLTLCREMGFQSLAGQIRMLGKTATPAAAKAPAEETFPAGEETFPFGANAPEPEKTAATADLHKPDAQVSGAAAAKAWQATYRLVDSEAACAEVFAALAQQPRFAIDLETTSLEPLQAEIVGIALSWQAGEACYLPLKGPPGSALLDKDRVLAQLRPILENPAIAKVNQNIKYDLLVLRGHGIAIQGISGDPMVADYLLHAGERSHGLEELARRYLNHQVTPITDLIGKKTRKQPQLRMDQVPVAKVCDYAGEDADVAWRLTELLERQLNENNQQAEGARLLDGRAERDNQQAEGARLLDGRAEREERDGTALRQLYEELEVPLVEVLAEMEYNGIRLDVPFLRQLGTEMGAQLATVEKEIYALAGHEFKISSLPQLRKVLFEELKLPVQGKTGVTGEPSTDQESLEKLAALNHPGAKLPRKILEQRQVAKLKSTYVDSLPDLVNPKTQRVHASFNQTVAATGRLSASDPNLQNIPVRREMGQQIRQAFVPEPGWLLLTADYSQIELRLLAHFCNDDELRQAFAEDRDVHAAVAAQIFNVPEKEVSSDQRRMAKTVNFGVIYGISPPGLAQRLEITRDEAAKFIRAYFKRYPKVEAYQANLLKECQRTGQVTTILGRRRKFDPTAIRDNSSYQNRNTAEREAINMEVQGSAADLIKLAMLNVFRRMRQEKLQARLLLQIHDELVFEVPPEELAHLAGLVRREMTEPVEKRLGLRVPLRVDLGSGPNWLEVNPL